MPPRKSNVSAISTTNEDGTPTKEPKDGVNIEVKPPSPLPQSTPSQLVPPPNITHMPLRTAKILPAPPRIDNSEYAMGPHGLLPYALTPQGLHMRLTAASFPYGPPGPPGAPGQYTTSPFHESRITARPSLPRAIPLSGPPSVNTYQLNPHADTPILAFPQDLSLPKTMVHRLAKGVLPANTQITKDAVLAMQKGATVFVNYLAQAANATAQTNNRRTIPPPAIFDALHELEFDFMSDWVSKELNKFNDTNAGKRNEYRRKLKEEEKLKREQEGGGVKGSDKGGDEDDEEDDDDDGERAVKRARMGGDDDREDEEGGVRLNGHRNREEEGMNGRDGRDEEEPIDVDDNDEADGNEAEREGQEELLEEEEEEEEDDEDEFPDEGRRLSSVEAETYTDGEVRARMGSEDDESMSDEGSE